MGATGRRREELGGTVGRGHGRGNKEGDCGWVGLTLTGAHEREEESEGVVSAIQSTEWFSANSKTGLLNASTLSHTRETNVYS